jgi:hypothetical protein
MNRGTRGCLAVIRITRASECHLLPGISQLARPDHRLLATVPVWGAVGADLPRGGIVRAARARAPFPFLGKIEQALPRTMNSYRPAINGRSRRSAGSDRRRSRKREGSCHDEIWVAQSRYHRRHHSRGMRWYFDRCACTCWPRRRPLRSFWEDGRGSLRRRGRVPALWGLSKRILWRMHRGRSGRFGTRPGPPLPYRRLHERMLIEILLPSLHLNVSGAYFRPTVFAQVARLLGGVLPLSTRAPS